MHSTSVDKNAVPTDKILRDLIPIPKSYEAKLALAYAEIAKPDLDAAFLLHAKGLYPQSVYMLQQSVEKSAKSFGLMLRLIKPNHLRMVSHKSVYALLIRADSLARYLGNSVQFLQTSKLPQVDILRDLGFGEILHKLNPLIPSEYAINRDRKAIETLSEAEMWQATLNLDETKKPVESALSQLKNIVWDKTSFLAQMKTLIGLTKLARKGELEAEYFFGLLRASPRVFALSLLTMWHETPTRYPPTSRRDYWEAGQYNENKALIKQFPMLMKQTRILSKNVYQSALAAGRLRK